MTENGTPPPPQPMAPRNPAEAQQMAVSGAGYALARVMAPDVGVQFAVSMLGAYGAAKVASSQGAAKYFNDHEPPGTLVFFMPDPGMAEAIRRLLAAAQDGFEAIKERLESRILRVPPGAQLPPIGRKD